MRRNPALTAMRTCNRQMKSSYTAVLTGPLKGPSCPAECLSALLSQFGITRRKRAIAWSGSTWITNGSRKRKDAPCNNGFVLHAQPLRPLHPSTPKQCLQRRSMHAWKLALQIALRVWRASKIYR